MLKENTVLKCNFNQGEHTLHTEDKQYNTLIDLIINFSDKVQEQDKNILRLLETIEVIQNKQTKTLEKVEHNFDFLKSQGLEIDKKIQLLNNKFSARPKDLDIQTIQLITDIISQIEKINTEISELKKIIQKAEEISLS